SDWEVGEATEAERRDLARREVELFGRGHALNPEWLLDQNPAGKALVLVARTPEGRIAGTRSLLPWRVISGGTEIRVGHSIRLWTEPEFRRQGVAIAIGRELERRSREMGYPVVYLFPSDRLLPRYRRQENRFEFALERRQLLISLRFFGSGVPAVFDWPLSWTRGWRSRARNDHRWSLAENAAELAGGLWEQIQTPEGVVGVRDASFVAWRFSAESGHAYLMLRYPARGPVRLLAAVHSAPENRSRILDVWGIGDADEKVLAVAGLVERLADQGTILIDWCLPEHGSDARIAARAGFLRRRRGVPMGVWMNQAAQELGDLADPRCYRLNEGDSDYA
ncbi:MAG TPA: GNAT family N-acetyltransferase, partial [Candidatus Eisenbacteria bacterium]|nr:GNAT family N-acetyltransferase [Candidatus Eisenbacteria bacterium]